MLKFCLESNIHLSSLIYLDFLSDFVYLNNFRMPSNDICCEVALYEQTEFNLLFP